MDTALLCFSLIISVAVVTVRKYYPEACRLPFLCLIGALSLVLLTVLIYAAYTMIIRVGFSSMQKVLYCVVVAAIITVIVLLNASVWKKYLKDRKG